MSENGTEDRAGRQKNRTEDGAGRQKNGTEDGAGRQTCPGPDTAASLHFGLEMATTQCPTL